MLISTPGVVFNFRPLLGTGPGRRLPDLFFGAR
jgi:hypothetical protein